MRQYRLRPGGRVDAVLLHQVRVARSDALEEARQVVNVEFVADGFEHLLEARIIGRAQVGRHAHTDHQYHDRARFGEANHLAQVIGALRETESAVEQQAEIYRSRRDVLVEGLRRIGWEVDPPKAGMFLWAKVPAKWLQRMDTMDFAMMLLEDGDVAVSPGSGFGPAGEGFLRMALVENESRLRQAVRQISRCLEKKEQEYASAENQPLEAS